MVRRISLLTMLRALALAAHLVRIVAVHSPAVEGELATATTALPTTSAAATVTGSGVTDSPALAVENLINCIVKSEKQDANDDAHETLRKAAAVKKQEEIAGVVRSAEVAIQSAATQEMLEAAEEARQATEALSIASRTQQSPSINNDVARKVASELLNVVGMVKDLSKNTLPPANAAASGPTTPHAPAVASAAVSTAAPAA
eukprot:TRINITY_DN13250_c1_g1_i3.p1 TRINITY_DN13250_c1_g1~~TRINITY_DN13250_c1_g1_i3.p1  ORF type:complete len:202 (+),score=47.28 TRINITY_DN13250_c1_g1_i3:101-706(+)